MLTSEISRKSLRKFVEWLPECEWEAVHWTLLACLKRREPFAWKWKMMTLPEDDEEETEEERLAVEEGNEDIRAGRVVPFEEVKKKFGIAP